MPQARPGHAVLGNIIFNWGNAPVNNLTAGFSKVYANTGPSVVATVRAATGSVGVKSVSLTGVVFEVNPTGTQFYWQAMGS